MQVPVIPLATPLSGTTQVGVGWRHPHYRQVLQELPAIDFLEVHSENFFAQGGASLSVLEQGRAHYPVSLHGVGLSLGSAVGLDAWHLDQLAGLVDRIEPVRVSDHACFARGYSQGNLVHASDLLPLAFDDDSLTVLCANVQRAQDRLKRQILIENLSAYLTWVSPDASVMWPEPEFLNEATARTGCGLLVDVNNIYVNALNAQIGDSGVHPLQSCIDWLDAIRPGSVGELHLAGHSRVTDAHGDIVIDDHGSRVCPPVWQLHAYALRRFGPVPTLIEWDTDVPDLSVLLAEATQAREACDNLLAVAL